MSNKEQAEVGEPVNVQETRKYERKLSPEEAKKWDFAAARPQSQKTNVLESIANLVKSCVGGGMVSMHAGYQKVGLLSGLIVNLICALFVGHVMYLLPKCAQRVYGLTQVPNLSYPDLAEATFTISKFKRCQKKAKCFRYLVDITVMVDQFGSCCCYMVIIARSLKQVIEDTETVRNEGIRWYIVYLIIPVLIICMITSMKYLAIFSLVADLYLVFVSIATIYYGTKAATKSPLDFPFFTHVPALLSYICVCVFSMESIGVTLPIENNMKDPGKIGLVLLLGMSACTVMTVFVGFFGYWGFGDKAKSPVTINFPMDGVWSMSFKACMALMLYSTLAINFWVPFNLAWAYIKKRYAPRKYWYVERIWRAVFVLIISSVAIVFPTVIDMMSVIGAICLSNSCFIYPATINIILNLEDAPFKLYNLIFLKDLIIIIFGALLCIFGTWFSVNDLIKTVYVD